MAKKNSSPSVTEVPSHNDDWETKNHARTIVEAHEIMQDPKKMKKVKKHLQTQKKAINSVQDLVKFRQAKYGPGGSSPSEPDMDGDGE